MIVSPKKFKYSISLIIVLAVALFLYITYYIVQNTLTRHVSRLNNKILSLENIIDSSINDSSRILDALSVELTFETLDIKNYNLNKILGSFGYKYNYLEHVPFSKLKVINSDNIIIANTAFSFEVFKPTNVEDDLDLIQRCRTHPLEVQVGSIRKMTHELKEIIPMCISINQKKEYLGAICSGLQLRKLNERLNAHVTSEHYGTVRLLNKSALNDRQLNSQSIKNTITLGHMLKYCFHAKQFKAYSVLQKYPNLVLEVDVNFYNISSAVLPHILYCVYYFLILIILLYGLFFIYKKFFHEPFYYMRHKLAQLPDCIAKQVNLDNSPHTSKFPMANLMNNLVDHYCSVHANLDPNLVQQSEISAKNDLLHLILTERHYCHNYTEPDFDTSTSALYLGQLKKLVSERHQTANLAKLLKNVAEYCSANHGLNIEASVAKKDSQDFLLKKAALNEAIFNIFALIIRIGQFNTEEETFIIRGSFENGNHFPSISISAPILNATLRSLSWEMGPSYIYTGLLSVYLLAKENNLLFHITQDENKIIFVLTPIECTHNPST